MTKIIIGGPPHSGKSSMMVLMKNNFRQKGINTGLIDLDYASPTLEWLEGEETKENRDLRKQPWTPELAEKAKADFIEVDKKFKVTLGDAPGKKEKKGYLVKVTPYPSPTW